MLTRTRRQPVNTRGGRFAIIASRYNALYVNAMLKAARGAFASAGAAVEVIRVPGAFEIPVVASALARRTQHRPEAIVCLGVIIQGETEHARLIAEGVTQALAAIQVEALMPVIHEVLLLRNKAQAQARCLGQDHNRGAEAARTALAMREALEQATRTA